MWSLVTNFNIGKSELFPLNVAAKDPPPPQLSHSNWLKMSLNISELQSRQILQIYIKRTLFLLWSALGLTLLVGLHSPCLLLVALTKNEGPAQVFVPFMCSLNFYFQVVF